MPPALATSLLSKIVAIGLFPFAPVWAVIVAVVPDLYLCYHMFEPSAQGLVRVLTRFETPRREVWLTIDDGPDPTHTPRLLDLLDEHQTRATFFVIGERVGRYPELVREIIRRGHTVGHHTQTHPTRTFWCASPARVRTEIDDALSALRRVGVTPVWFRPPVGIKGPFLRQILAERALVCTGWSIRSFDSVNPDPKDVVTKVMKQVRPGSIILMHEGPGVHPQTGTEAIALLLNRLRAGNYTCILPRLDQLA